MKRVDSKDFLSLAGRVFLAGIFLAAGYSKFRQAEETEQYMASKKLPAISLLRPAVGTAEFLAALSLILGYKPRSGALASLLYLIPTSVIFHGFWNEPKEQQSEQMIHFLKNLAIIGGLLEVVAHGPGRIAVEHGSDLDMPVRRMIREVKSLRAA